MVYYPSLNNMDQFIIEYQQPLGHEYGFSLRSAYSRIGTSEYVGSGISNDDTVAKSKAVSELIERISQSNGIQSTLSLYTCVWNRGVISLTPKNESLLNHDSSQIFSSACRDDIGIAIQDAAIEMHERAHLDKWCSLVLDDFETLNIYEIVLSNQSQSTALCQYINNSKVKLFLSWVNYPGFIPCFIIIGQLEYSDRYILVSSSAETTSSALYKGLLDIAKILNVNENIHRFPGVKNLFHYDKIINRLCQTRTIKCISTDQISLLSNFSCEKQITFDFALASSELSKAMNFYPVSISRLQASRVFDFIEINKTNHNAKFNRTRGYFS